MDQTSGNDPHKSGMPSVPTDIIAFVGHGVEFKGMLTYKGSVRIDGQFDGEIETDDTLYIGDQATVTAQIRAGSVIASGRITGNITARERVELKSPAIIDASLQTPKLSIGNGVVMNGDITMRVPGSTPQGKADHKFGEMPKVPKGLADSQSSLPSAEEESHTGEDGGQVATEPQPKKKK